MTSKPATIQASIDSFSKVWGKSTPFNREEFATTLAIPIGTASAICSYAAKLGLLTHNFGRPRKYSLPKAPAAQATPSIDKLLDLVADIESRGGKRSTIAPLLIWIAEALQSK